MKTRQELIQEILATKKISAPALGKLLNVSFMSVYLIRDGKRSGMMLGDAFFKKLKMLHKKFTAQEKS